MNDTTQQTSAQRDDEKSKLFRFTLQHYDSIFVHLNPLHADVVVPFRLKNQVQVVLQLGLSMPVPITDLIYDIVGFSATLSFGGNPFHVSIPWEACFAIVADTGKGKVWNVDMPEGLRSQMAERQEEVFENKKTQQYLRPVNKVADRVGWGVIDGGKT